MKTGFLLVMLPFLVGILISDAVSNDFNVEMPLSDGTERTSPHDRIKESQIFAYDDKVVLQIKGASLAKYADTNSMDPLLDKDSNGIEIEPGNEDDLHVGDVVAYELNNELIVHRITEINYDGKGKYFMLKGDNLRENDPYKIRFNQVKYVLVGIIY